MSNTPAISVPDIAAADSELQVRDLLVTTAWALAAAVRSSGLIAGDVDAVSVVNAALAEGGFPWRLRPLH